MWPFKSKEIRAAEKTAKICQRLRLLTENELLDVSFENVISRKISSTMIEGIFFIFQKMSPEDLWAGIDWTRYQEAKEAKASAQEAEAAKKDQKLARERERRFMDHMEEVFSRCVLHPNKVTPRELAENAFIGPVLYWAIISNTLGQKKNGRLRGTDSKQSS